MENNFEEKRKDIDFSSIDIDSQIYQRKKLELDYKYDQKRLTETDYCDKEMELANNNDDEMHRRLKAASIKSDYENRMKRIQEEYDKELEEIKLKYVPKYNKPYYFKWMYIGDVSKYERIINGLSYYVKLNEFDKLSVYDDVKFSKLIAEIAYIPSEWREV